MPAPGNIGDSAEGLSAALSDRYEVVREHARGGMSTVYLAVDRKHDRQVALKVLAPELAAGVGSERFLREIQIAAHLNHPHILPLLDSGIAAGLPFYVMPLVEEESLRTRLEREGPLPLGEGVRIAVDVGEALAYAHARGVIHRDIKPGNILLAEGSAIVTDFGIAAAIEQAPGEHLTRTGLSVGSVGYMSPEQASGDASIDGRADQYSLACVLFEMLAGRLPFTGRNARMILGQQLTLEPPAVSTLRPEIPPELDATLRRALSRNPEDRFPTVSEFVEALAVVSQPTASIEPGSRLRPALLITLGAGLLLIGPPWLLRNAERRVAPAAAMLADTSTYAVFPFDNRAGPEVQLQETVLLRAALKEWDGVEVVDAFQLSEAMERTGRTALNTDEAAAVAIGSGAGRFVMGGIVRLPDASISVDATLYAATDSGAVVLATKQERLTDDDTDVDGLFTMLATYLLWRGNPPMGHPDSLATRSLEAGRAFAFGFEAVKRWNLAEADTAFTRALQWDPDYPDAYLWRGLVRAWSGGAATAWSISAEQAALRRDRLSDREAAMAEALVLQGRGEYGEACPKWKTLTEEYPSTFAAWYGLAVCLDSDNAVVRDSRSPTGWSFRGSRHGLVEAYRQAYRILPSILESFRMDSYASLRKRFYLTGSQGRIGFADPGGEPWVGFATWAGDTLAFWPRPWSAAFEPVSAEESRLRSKAIDRLRIIFREVAANWASEAPNSGSAREALATSMALVGDRTAIDTIHRARTLASDASASYRIAATEVWLRVAFGLPRELYHLERAKALADSLLTVAPAPDRFLASGLAALTGRALRAASEFRDARPTGVPGPAALESDQAALLVFAALGGPRDSLDRLDRDLAAQIESSLPVKDRAGQYAWLGLPASLAFASHPLPGRERSETDWLVRAQLEYERGDGGAARELLRTKGSVRPQNYAFSRTLDALFAEAALWAAMDEPRTVVEWLDPTLAVLPEIPNQLAHVERAGGLVRSAVLRAEAAAELGDDQAARDWARAVLTLWSDADPFLDPALARMRRLADCASC